MDASLPCALPIVPPTRTQEPQNPHVGPRLSGPLGQSCSQPCQCAPWQGLWRGWKAAASLSDLGQVDQAAADERGINPLAAGGNCFLLADLSSEAIGLDAGCVCVGERLGERETSTLTVLGAPLEPRRHL